MPWTPRYVCCALRTHCILDLLAFFGLCSGVLGSGADEAIDVKSPHGEQ